MTDVLSSKESSRVAVRLRSGQTLKGLLKSVVRDELVLDIEDMGLIVFKRAVDVVQVLARARARGEGRGRRRGVSAAGAPPP